MTIRELQSLIADIDCVLAGDGSGSDRLERGSETVAHQAILERVRHYLLSVQDRIATPELPESLQQQTAGAIASAVIQQIEGQRSTWMQPWQMELETVRQQRNVLLREIQQLEGQRQQLVGDFLRVLLDRASESLKQEFAQTLERLETQAIYQQSLTEPTPGSAPVLPKSPTQRLEQLQQLQVQSDRLLMSLDSTFRQVFSTLERDIQGYERSLSAAIGRMYALGMQDKSLFAANLVDAPTELQSELPSQPPLEILSSQPTQPQPSDFKGVYPFAGLELSSSAVARDEGSKYEPTVDIESMDDAEIDVLLQLDAIEPTPNRAEELEATREGYPDPWDAPDLKPADNEAELDRLEHKLFGTLEDPARGEPPEAGSEDWARASIPVEAGLFESAPPAPIAAPSHPVEVIAHSSPSESLSSEADPESEERANQPMADTIASLTELLDRAYTDVEAETETYSAVPAGESLIASEEPSSTGDISVEQALEDPQLGQRLDEDLQRFGREGTIDLSKPPLPEPNAIENGKVEEEVADTPPEELLGENLGDIDLDDLWAAEENRNSSPVKAKDGSAVPEEIVTDPWSPPANPSDSEASNN